MKFQELSSLKLAIRFLGLLSIVYCLCSCGCIRVAGSAGYWHKNPDEETVKSKQVGFDTEEITHPGKEPGSITP